MAKNAKQPTQKIVQPTNLKYSKTADLATLVGPCWLHRDATLPVADTSFYDLLMFMNV